MRNIILALALGALFAVPAIAQQTAAPPAAQPAQPNVVERIDGAVRGFFNRVFGGNKPAPAEAPKAAPAAADSAPVPPVAPAAQAPAAPAAAAETAPAAQAPVASPSASAPASTPGPVPAAAPRVRSAEAQPAEVPIARSSDRGLHDAIARGDYDAALKMLEQGASVEGKDSNSGASVLHFAVMRGRLPIIDLLIARGADVNSKTKTGTTPTHTAVLYGQLPAIELLAVRRADLNAKSNSGITPLQLAVAAKKDVIAERLKELGGR